DQGSNWSTISVNPIPTNVHAFTMWTGTDGFRIWEDDISQQEACAVTHDGGKTFTDIRGDATLQKYITQLPKNGVSIKSDWSDSLHGTISVSGNIPTKAYPILLTTDGGHSWNEQYLKYKGDSTIKLGYTYLYPGSGSIWVVPSVPKVAQFFYYSSDFGKTWIASDTIKSGNVAKLAPVSKTAVWVYLVGSLNFVSGSSNVIAYKDFSAKWAYIDTVKGPSFFIPLSIQDIQFADPYHGWVRASFEPGTDTTKHDPFSHFFRFSANVPNSVPLSNQIAHLRCIPNPAISMIKISGFAEDERVLDMKLSNAIGKECICSIQNIGKEAGLDVRSQPDGCYFVTIRTTQRTESVPVVIMHY
ncbi:MAG: hypothetical protein ACHQM6_11035, partial [Candidatus Kapaibacterium sp.]